MPLGFFSQLWAAQKISYIVISCSAVPTHKQRYRTGGEHWIISGSHVIAWKHFHITAPLQRESPHKGPVVWSFDVFCVVKLNKLLHCWDQRCFCDISVMHIWDSCEKRQCYWGYICHMYITYTFCLVSLSYTHQPPIYKNIVQLSPITTFPL